VLGPRSEGLMCDCSSGFRAEASDSTSLSPKTLARTAAGRMARPIFCERGRDIEEIETAFRVRSLAANGIIGKSSR
jgi:hypothetical protein